ncbi:hypothetical protein M8756_08660 [Lutimaribacter sp. EGI FJ00015]|uniref:Uncharacterized protein n=1 Tax=Lutimaribacter degradans TaxID=2945989 RepID=A0ACC5ZXE7_9RHOB|nr:hypothetical protein [Lutimaribacter sp. EGI FJ00013]MCM2562224.1 hypothetical protein [Lutimaribacter sp. EGI FJ00013]MCO0613379.1 hypothetical protein [Lutimaribacter sp. EGI FJ00015]MCO0636353.1 hypothetical protein [Lutimaribacter sp. EGI FJ00014]
MVRAAYGRADVILEYGSGGSTVLGAEMGKRVLSVESDQDWAKMMRDWFTQNPPEGEVDIIWSDIGPTKEWGHPVDDRAWKRFARYPLEVWDMPEFAHPDVVLVDGRFRVGCALAAAYRITRPVGLYFDDYVPRKRFHEVEEFIGPPAEIAGRMARFELRPQAIPPDRLLRMVQLMTRP